MGGTREGAYRNEILVKEAKKSPQLRSDKLVCGGKDGCRKEETVWLKYPREIKQPRRTGKREGEALAICSRVKSGVKGIGSQKSLEEKVAAGSLG